MNDWYKSLTNIKMTQYFSTKNYDTNNINDNYVQSKS